MKHPLKLTKVALACIFLNAGILLVHGACPNFIPCTPCMNGAEGPPGPAGNCTGQCVNGTNGRDGINGTNGICTQPCVNGTSGIQSFGNWIRPEGTAAVMLNNGDLVPFPTATVSSVNIIATPSGTGTAFTLPNAATYLVLVGALVTGGGDRFNILLDGSPIAQPLFRASPNNSIDPYFIMVTTTVANQVLSVALNDPTGNSQIGAGSDANGPQTSMVIIQLN